MKYLHLENIQILPLDRIKLKTETENKCLIILFYFYVCCSQQMLTFT